MLISLDTLLFHMGNNNWNKVFEIIENYQHLGQYRTDIINGAKDAKRRKLKYLLNLDIHDPITKGIVAIKKRYAKNILAKNIPIKLD